MDARRSPQGGRWKAYSPELSLELEMTYQGFLLGGTNLHSYSYGMKSFCVNMSTLQQKNTQTQFERPVRRRGAIPEGVPVGEGHRQPVSASTRLPVERPQRNEVSTGATDLKARQRAARANPIYIADDDPIHGAACMICGSSFSLLNNRHHCRYCGWLVCSACSPGKLKLDRHIPVRGRSVGESYDSKRNPKAAGEKARRVCAACEQHAPAEMRDRQAEAQRLSDERRARQQVEREAQEVARARQQQKQLWKKQEDTAALEKEKAQFELARVQQDVHAAEMQRQMTEAKFKLAEERSKIAEETRLATELEAVAQHSIRWEHRSSSGWIEFSAENSYMLSEQYRVIKLFRDSHLYGAPEVEFRPLVTFGIR
eukprot:COSAG02_NODE_2844_length_7905_cov_33.004356_7_plen_369_part_01